MKLRLLFLLSTLALSCSKDIPTEEGIFDNPLDEEEVTYETPALTFYPSSVETAIGSSFPVQVFALAVENVAGTFVRVEYEKNKLRVLSVGVGDFLSDSQDPIFFYSDDDVNGWVDINTSFLGSDSSSVSGTGSFAEIVFTTLTAGTSILNYGQSCELVDPDDVQIQIKGFGTGTVDVQ